MKAVFKLILIVVLAAVLVFIVILANGGKSGDGAAPVGAAYLSEVMSKNDGAVADSNGQFHDWIELGNSTANDIDISGYGLSDDLLSGVKYVIPTGTKIPANGFILVYCSGDTSLSGGLYAGFRLSETDQVVFYDASGKVADSIELYGVEAGKTLARAADKTWSAMDPSPLFPNTEEGIAQYLQKKQELANSPEQSESKKSVVINEFMASNLSTIPDATGNYSDYIELYNLTDNDINLSGCGLSDDLSRPSKFVIPDGVTIGAKQYLLIFCSGNEGMVEGQLHVPFGLRAYEEDVVLCDQTGRIIDSYSYSRQEGDIATARQPDGTGEFASTESPTPGYPNTAEGYEEFMNAYLSAPQELYISEVMGLGSTLTDNGSSETNDWIELHNISGNDINLEGYALSDTANNPAKWVFPDTTLPSGGYLCVLASGNNVKDASSGGYYHTNFKLSSEGEMVFLFDPNGNLTDKLRVTRFISGMSTGKGGDGSVLYYSEPTPGAENAASGAYHGLTSVPTFSVNPGIFDEAVSIEITAGANEEIYYTTDCTSPSRSSSRYTQPITVEKNTVIRAIAYRDGYYSDMSQTSGTYLFTSDNVNHTLPVVCLVTDPDNLWDGDTGIYTYGNKWSPTNGDTWPYWQTPANFWQDWEKPASFEVFDENKNCVFRQNVGIKISGAFGRGREQKGIAVYARDEYGSDRLKYPFFDELEYTEYKSLVLRCGAQDQSNGKIRDELSAALLYNSDVNFLYQCYKPYVLYLNGKYWGVYFLREKRSRFFVASHENTADVDSMDLIKSETRTQFGTGEDWKAIRDYANTHDLTVDEYYNHVADSIDMDSFIDYMICEIYVGNSDYWNMQMYKLEGGKWKFIYYDFCWGWNNVEHKTLNLRRQDSQPASGLFNALLKRADWRDKFLRRFSELMDTVFKAETVLQKIDELYAQVQPEIARERSIFNSADSPYFDYVDPDNRASVEGFESHIKKIRNFAEKRREIMLAQIKAEFNLSDEYMKEVFNYAG